MKLSDLLNVKVFNIGDDEYDSTLLEDLDISSIDSNAALESQPRLMAAYGFAYEHALAEERKLVDLLEFQEALCDIRTRAEFKQQGPNFKFTEAMVANQIKTNEQILTTKDKLREAKANSSLLKAAYEAIKHRKDSAVTIAHNVRAEMKSSNV